MVKTCNVIDCGKTTTKQNVSVFMCPNDQQSMYKWGLFLERANKPYEGFWKPNKQTYICSDHFHQAELEILPSTRLRLKKNACPRLVEQKEIISHEELDYELKSNTITINGPQREKDECMSKRNEELLSKLEEWESENKSLRVQLEKKDREIMELRGLLEKKRTLILNYQQRFNNISRREKRQVTRKRKLPVKAPESIKRAKLSSEERLSNEARKILDELIERSKKSSNSTFTERLREFAYELHFYSPRCYEKLRETIVTLPFASSFRRWTSHVKSSVGFIPSAFEFINSRVKESEHQIFYSLMVDEVHIRKQIVAHQGGFLGFVNYGDMAESIFTNKEASAALFVMANEINGHNKIPLGYILTNGLKANVLSQVLKNSLIKLKEVHAKVLSITFDGLNVNFKAAEILGAKLDVTSAEFSPTISGDAFNDIHIILDASHMLKLMRNLFKEYGTLVNESGDEIKWEYIVALEKLQTAEGLRLANKITSRHTNYQNQKMKTKLAAQTLSGSGAIALRFCRTVALPGFEKTEATEEFLNINNKLFDYLNSVRHGRYGRAPLTWARYDEVCAFFALCKQYFLSLKWRRARNGSVTDIPLIDSPRNTAIHGLIITMRSIELIMAKELSSSTSDLKYLSTFKLSQDPLENFFSSLRTRYGFNNNPNVLQLEHGVKSLICMKTRAITTGNCVEQEDLSTKISALGNFKTIIDDEAILSEIDEDDESHELPDVSLVVSNIVMYISGFVGRKLVKKLHCQSCILKLLAAENDLPLICSESTLTMYRDRGGLFLSSHVLYSICKITEQLIRSQESLNLRKLKKEGVVNSVYRECVERGISGKIDCGYRSHKPFESCHAIDLIKQIATVYAGTRFNHIAKQATLHLKPTTNRNVLTKSIHFSGN